MPDSEEIARQLELLAIQRRTLHHYLRQQATFGGAHTPPEVTHGVREARAEIKRIKTFLRTQEAVVNDQPQDDATDDDVVLGPSANPSRQRMGAIVLVIGGVIGVVMLLWRVALPFVLPPLVREQDNSPQPPSGTASSSSTASASPQLTVALPEGDTVTIPYYGEKITYKIMRAEVQPLSSNQALLHLVIRATTTFNGISFFVGDFRLRINDQMLRSEGSLDEHVYPNETKDGVIEFLIPSQPTQAHLMFTIGQVPAELLLDIK